MAGDAAPPRSPFDPEPTPAPPPPPPLTPGKVAMWLFLATEVMFFTGLIGFYIVLRAGSPNDAYSNLYPPNTDLSARETARGVVVDAVGANLDEVVELILEARDEADDEDAAHEIEHQLEFLPTLVLVDSPYEPNPIERLQRRLERAGATVRIEDLTTYPWPEPYKKLINPLSIDLTALNTFILICSSVTMVLALAAIQRGDQKKLSLWLLATILIGSVFLSIQVFEYYQLIFGHRYSPGVSATGHFRPDVSLFASCFFTMTGFHGAHVTGGVITLSLIFIQSLMGTYTKEKHAPVELAGLYWHFVDLVWIILFTVVYLI